MFGASVIRSPKTVQLRSRLWGYYDDNDAGSTEQCSVTAAAADTTKAAVAYSSDRNLVGWIPNTHTHIHIHSAAAAAAIME